MASRTTTDPIEILLEMGVDLDNLSEEEDYLSALKEAIATIQFQTKGSGDERSRILQEEVIKVRKKRKAEDSKFRAKKTVISADSIRPIRSPQLRSQKIPAQKLLPGAAQDSESEETKEKKKRTRKGKTVEVPATFITSVSKSVKSILGTLKQQSSFLKKTAEKDRKAAEREKRSVAETKLESKFFKPIIEAAQKVVAPVKGILSKIFDFFVNVFLAKVVVKIADWMSNPDNQRKVTNTIRFLTDHGPKLLLAYILFGNRLGRFITGLAARLIFGAVRLAAAGFKLIAALPWWAKVGLAGTALFGAGAVVPKVFPGTTKDVADDAADALKAERGAEAAAEEITRQNTERNFLQMFGDFITGAGAERTEQADRLTTGTEARYGFFGELQERSDPTAMFSGGGMVGFPQLGGGGGGLDALTNQAKVRTLGSSLSDPTGIKARRAFFNDPQAYLSDEDFKNRGIFPEDRNRKKTGRRVRGYEQGGEVDGPGGVDKVPAMLTDGEFVMSRGAVQKYGLSTLESMNAAGGGTNKPKIVENTYYAVGGGGIGPSFAEHSSDHSHSSRPSRTGGIDPGGILGRYVYGDQSIPNLIAQGKFKEALEALNIKLDINLDGVKQLIDNAMAGLQGLSDQVMSGAAQLYNQGLVFAEQAKQFAQEINPLPAMGRALSSFAENPYMGEEAIDKLTQERIASGELTEDGLGLTKTTQKNLDDHDAYIRGLYDPDKDTGFMGGLKKINQDIQNRGLIADPLAMLGLKNEGTEQFVENLTFGRVKNLGAKLTGLQMAAKGLMGPVGRMFQIDDRGSLGRYLRPAMEEAQRQGHTSVGREALGGTKYDELVGDKLANLALGQVHFEVDEQGRAKTSDVFDASAMTPKQYLVKSRESLSLAGDILQGKAEGGPVGLAKALYQSAFMGLSGRLATAQNTGFGNLRPMGLDIDLGGGFETKDVPSESEIKSVLKPGAEGYFSSTTGQFYPSYADALKDPRVKAAAQVEQTKKKLSFAPTQQPNLTIPGTPVTQRPKVTITNIQENASSGGNSSTGGNNPVPSIPMPPASSSKTKVLGFLPEPLQFF
tara:strand:- start:1392 stop:4589 length:3198 start_codon:yes stop_codon:yes gene_type:complete